MLASLHLQYSQSLPWVILLIGGLSLLTLLAYPAQLRQMPRRWRWLPPALRILAITAIGLSILRPAVIRARIASERAPIVVLLDSSRSMSAVDTNRTPGEWVGIAAAMGRLPADARDIKTAAFQADCDRISSQADDVARARAELDYAKLAGRGVEAAQAQLDQVISEFQATARDARAKMVGVSTTKKLEQTLAYLVRIQVGIDREQWLNQIGAMAQVVANDAEAARIASDKQLFQSDLKIRDACLPLQSLSRLQISESAVLDPDNGLLARLGPETAVRLLGISDHATAVELRGRSTKPEPLTADGNSTNLTGGIRLVLESLKAAPPRAVVLFSDGRQINAESDAATIAAIQGIPIFTVGAAPPHWGVSDLSISSANVTANAIVGEAVRFDATVRSRGMSKDTFTDVTLTGGGTQQTQRINFPADKQINVSFEVVLTQPGQQRLSLDVAGVPGEASLENNHVERWVTVMSAATRPSAKAAPATQPTAEQEMMDLRGDDVFLGKLSSSSGGQFFRLDQVDLLAKRLADLRDDVSHPIEVPLWDGPYLFVFVLGCLAAEWGMRKRHGLA